MLDSPHRMPLVLAVCTGNICRSPIAEGFLRSAFDRRLGPDAPEVRSAGLIAQDGAPAEPGSVRAAGELGVDISAHAARRLTEATIREALLVLGMAAEHRSAVVAAVPEAAPRTFTLRELVALLEALAVRDLAAPAGLAGRVAAAHALRRADPSLRPALDDVPDPLGLSLPAFRSTARELADLCSRLVDGLVGAPDQRTVAGGRGA
ncbi:MAG: low molecular weight phosphatase family protein [Candidatus Velamenicoccus archaeovorus]